MRHPSLIRERHPTAAAAAPCAAGEAPGARGVVHTAILALVWVTFASSSLVFSEPAPVDALLACLTVVLPAAGLVTITPSLTLYMSLWLVAAAAGFLSSTVSRDFAPSAIFTAISLYLYAASFVLAGFLARAPRRHAGLILSGWTAAALLAAVAGLAGYFNVVPGAFELFTKFGRASGTFKDPNVFGPFLVTPFLFALHLVLHRPWRSAPLLLAAAGVLALAVLLSFSRGAWINLAVALVVYGALAYLTAGSDRQRGKIALLVLCGCGLVALVTLIVLQNDQIGAFLQERASLTQSYDVGPAGRFGGQEKAIGLILDHPFGIGAGQFALHYHHEEVHNVFLSMVLNAGWLGGLTYWLMTGLTVCLGIRHALHAQAARPLFLIVYSAFLATALEGIVIDTDHWRSFYILMAMVWGMAASPHDGNGEPA